MDLSSCKQELQTAQYQIGLKDMRIAELEHHNEQLERIRKDIITSISINDRSMTSSRLMQSESMCELPQQPLIDEV